MDVGETSVKDFIEWFGALLIGLLTIGGQAWTYIRGTNEKEEPGAPKHMILERADLADMTPLRAVAIKLDALIEQNTDIHDIVEGNARILEILEKMQQAEEIQRKAEELAARIISERRDAEDRRGRSGERDR